MPRFTPHQLGPHGVEFIVLENLGPNERGADTLAILARCADRESAERIANALNIVEAPESL